MTGRRHLGMLGCDRGQALVETVALLPILVLASMLGLQGLAAGVVRVQAEHALHVAVLAAQRGDDVTVAARRAVPGWSRSRLTASVKGDVVHVKISPRALFPGASRLLAVSAEARFDERVAA